MYRQRVAVAGRCPLCEFEHNVPFLRARTRILSDPHAVTYAPRPFVAGAEEEGGEEGEGKGKRGWWKVWGRGKEGGS